jgi:hypothetical protein
MGPLLLGLVTRLRAGRPRGPCSVPGVRMTLSFLRSVEIDLKSLSVFRLVGTRSSSSGVVLSRCEADSYPPYSGEVMYRWTFISLLSSRRGA